VSEYNQDLGALLRKVRGGKGLEVEQLPPPVPNSYGMGRRNQAVARLRRFESTKLRT